MKHIYIIATAAAKRMDSEQALWSGLKNAGLAVRDIHDLPRIAQHDVAVAGTLVAGLVKKRVEKAGKDVKLICLITSKGVLAQRLKDVPEEQIPRIAGETEQFALQHADFCVPADDLDVAARLIVQIIKAQEEQ